MSKDPSFSQKEGLIDLIHPRVREPRVICADELGPLSPRAYPAPPGWISDGNRVNEQVAHWREPDKTWVYGGSHQ